jgi:hypothetical protein
MDYAYYGQRFFSPFRRYILQRAFRLFLGNQMFFGEVKIGVIIASIDKSVSKARSNELKSLLLFAFACQ